MSFKTILNPFSKTLQFIIDEDSLSVDDSNLITNDLLIAFRSAINGSFSIFQMIDGIVDDYQDETGINTGSSINELFESGQDLYHPDRTLAGFDAETKLLLHMDGTDTSTTFTDEIGNTVTANGNAQIDTAQSKFGGASALFDGSGDYLSIPDSDDWSFGSEDFTLEMWLRPNSVVRQMLLSQGTIAGNTEWDIEIDPEAAAPISIVVNESAVTTFLRQTSGDLTLNDWNHLAFVRSGSNFFIFVNGISQPITSSVGAGTFSFPNFAAPLIVGARNNFTLGYSGHMDEVRISKGIARWTSNFTPSSTPYAPATGEIFDMTLISDIFTADTEPSSSQLILLEEDVDTITLNTDLKAYVSRDGGSTFTQGSLSYDIDFDTNIKVLIANVDLSSQPSGTSMVYKSETLNSKDLNLETVIHIVQIVYLLPLFRQDHYILIQHQIVVYINF